MLNKYKYIVLVMFTKLDQFNSFNYYVCVKTLVFNDYVSVTITQLRSFEAFVLSTDVADYIPAKVKGKFSTPISNLSAFCADKFAFLLTNIPFIWI